MPDLRDVLERRSRDFDLEPGFLQRTLERGERIRRRRRVTSGIVALVIGLGGVTLALTTFRGDPGGVPLDRPSTTQVLPIIPDGVYWTRPISRSEISTTLADAGFSVHEAKEFFFRPGLPFRETIRFGLVIQDGFWFQTARADSGRKEAGWSGSYRITAPDTVVARGYGCTITYRFALSGSSLTLDVVSETGTSPECGQGDRVAQTAIFDTAPFVRQG
jgi:hypothetical protein